MEEFENREMTRQEEDSTYHGEGTGRREETAPNPAYNAYHTSQQSNPYQPPYYQHPHYQGGYPGFQEPVRKKKSGKVWKGIIATVLAILVIAGSCSISSFLTARYIKNQNNAQLQQYVDQKVQEVLDSMQGSADDTPDVIVTVDGFSASEIYAKNINSVVAVTCTISAGNSQNDVATTAGSGFIITEDGFIVTNYHVVEGASSVNVTLANGKKLPCQVRGFDATNDVALLKADAAGLKPVTIGRSSELKVGDPVVAIGNALGTLSFSLTAGNISGVDREITTDGSVINMLQTDAAINSGNSGGPLFNAKGEVIGITTAKYSGTTSSGASIEGISFAIPMDDVVGLLGDLKDHGYVTGAYLGVTVTDVDPAAQAYGVPAGAYVLETVQGNCAARAGIQSGDIIVKLGGYDVTGVNTLTRALRNFKGGDTSTVVVWRSGQLVSLRITFDEKPQA